MKKTIIIRKVITIVFALMMTFSFFPVMNNDYVASADVILTNLPGYSYEAGSVRGIVGGVYITNLHVYDSDSSGTPIDVAVYIDNTYAGTLRADSNELVNGAVPSTYTGSHSVSLRPYDIDSSWNQTGKYSQIDFGAVDI